MPVIAEEDESATFEDQDFTQLLDLPSADFAGANDAFMGAAAPVCTAETHEQDSIDCICHGFLENWDLPAQSADPLVPLEEPDYAKFENWIPQFIRPEKPCGYCRTKRLNCYITRGEIGCTPCNALFRECSLNNTRTLEANNQSSGLLIDTLHAVDEDAVKEHGGLTGIKPLRSKARASGTSTPIRNIDDEPGSSKRNGIRFPRHAVKTLRDWLDAHADNPYPTEDEKAELEKTTELKPSQIANWLANARRRKKVTERARPRSCTSPSLGPSTPAIAIPQPDKPWDELNPFERWKNSPPENEPASITDIYHAVVNSDLPDDQVSTSPSSLGLKKKRSSAGSGFSNIRAQSTTSFETGHSSSLSASNSAAYSQHSSQSHGSFGSFSSSLAGKKDRRRRRRPVPNPVKRQSDDKKRIFQCTFCTDTFKSKYDWTRHEKSLHLSLEKWICAPLGPVITDPATGRKRCVYCDEQNPTEKHVEAHNYRDCEQKGLDARTFYRKDHLRQHLRLVHDCEMTTFMENWKSTAIHINSRCGFCAQRFTVWQERVDHLTAHFKAGSRMVEWKGCRGLDPAVAAQVTNAMPPYLIGMESISPNPFSAANKSSWRQLDEFGTTASELENPSRQEVSHRLDYSRQEGEPGYPTKATCWEILTVRLGKYANEMAQEGVVLTDEMLQSQARIILYDSDDSWNQTSADNPEWLDLFKKAHGLDFIPSAVGGQGTQVPEDLETYGDLGLRVPFAVQLQAYNQDLAATDICKCNKDPAEHLTFEHNERIAQLRTMYIILSNEGVLCDPSGKCAHMECDNNIVDLSLVDQTDEPKYQRFCTYDLPPDKAKAYLSLTASRNGSNSLRANEDLSSSRYEGLSRRLTKSSDTAATSARSQGLEALARMESPLPMSPNPDTGFVCRKPFLQRHRYEMPKHRAQRFATTTAAWEDSGTMPEVLRTSVPDIDQTDTTTTGAMMEFLGGDIGQDLPFSTDAATSTIPLTSGYDWTVPTTAADEATMLETVDRLIAETTPPQTQQQQPFSTDAFSSVNVDTMTDLTMNNMAFDDLEMDFDATFDVPMDDSYEQFVNDV